MKIIILMTSLFVVLNVFAKEEKRTPADVEQFKITVIKNGVTSDDANTRYTRVIDPLTGVVCYSVIPYGDKSSAISCIKVDKLKDPRINE